MNKDMTRSIMMRHARRWGLTDPALVEVALPVVEVIAFNESNTISLFLYEGRWAYCMSIQFTDCRCGWGPYLKFADPHPTRRDALEVVVAEIVARGKRAAHNSYNRSLVEWARSLIAPIQMSLFDPL